MSVQSDPGNQSRDPISSERRLFADGAVYAVVEIAQQALGFIALPLFLFFLNATDFGAVTWGLTVAQIAAGLGSLGLEFSVVRLYWLWAEGERAGIAARIAVVSMAWSVLAGVAASLGIWHWGSADLRVPVILGVWAGAALGVRSIALSVLRVRGPIRRYARVVLSGAVVQTASALLLVWAGWKSTGYLSGYALGAILTVAPALRELGPWRSVGVSGAWLPREVVTFTLHTFPANMMNRVMAVADRLVLGSTSEIATLGVYGVAARFTMPMRFVSGVFKMALGPSLSRGEATAGVETTFWRLGSLVTMLLLLAGSLVASAAWFVRVTPWAFAQTELQRIVLILVVAELLTAMTSLGQLRLYYSKAPQDASIAAVASAVMLVALLVLLVPRFGGNGAATARILTAAIGLIAVVGIAALRSEGRQGWARLALLIISFTPALVAPFALGGLGQIVIFTSLAFAYGIVAWRRLMPLWRARAVATVH